MVNNLLEDTVISAPNPFDVLGASDDGLSPSEGSPAVGCPCHLIEAVCSQYPFYSQSRPEPDLFTCLHRPQILDESAHSNFEAGVLVWGERG